MSLREKQSKFTFMVSNLIIYAYSLGYEITFGDAYRDPRVLYGHPRSCHRSRLAIDLNLFKGSDYISSDDDHAPLHDYWDKIGGAERIKGDGNHYSLEHNGVK